jgi:hypothetical protein
LLPSSDSMYKLLNPCQNTQNATPKYSIKYSQRCQDLIPCTICLLFHSTYKPVRPRLSLRKTEIYQEQNRQCTYNVTMTRFPVTIVAVEKQCYILVCVCVCVRVRARARTNMRVGDRARGRLHACACV